LARGGAVAARKELVLAVESPSWRVFPDGSRWFHIFPHPDEKKMGQRGRVSGVGVSAKWSGAKVRPPHKPVWFDLEGAFFDAKPDENRFSPVWPGLNFWPAESEPGEPVFENRSDLHGLVVANMRVTSKILKICENPNENAFRSHLLALARICSHRGVGGKKADGSPFTKPEWRWRRRRFDHALFDVFNSLLTACQNGLNGVL
jgi:hypothetical protein